jgi:hypothetical protein
MNWVMERRFRLSVVAVVLVFLLLFVVMTFTGIQLLHDYDTRAASCSSHMDCGWVERYFSTFRTLGHVWSTLLLAFPPIAGIFWGTMLASDLASSSVDSVVSPLARRRWVLRRIALVTAVVVVLTAILSAAVTWWQSPLDRFNDNPFKSFDIRDIAPVAYAAFAVPLGVLVGAVFRRRLAAIAIVLAAFAGVRVIIDKFVRPNLVAEVWASGRHDVPGLGGSQVVNPFRIERGAWVLASRTVSASNRVLTDAIGIGKHGIYGIRILGGFAYLPGVGRCPNRIPGATSHLPWHPSPASRLALQGCVDSLHLREVVGYIPTSSYWPLQLAESAIYLVLAAALVALCVRLVVRRAEFVSPAQG